MPWYFARVSVRSRWAQRIVSLLVASSVSSSLAASAGCSGASSEAAAPASVTDASSTAPAQEPDDLSEVRDASAEATTSATPDLACKDSGTAQACYACCIQNHQAGYAVLLGGLMACACAPDGGTCVDDCKATACAGVTPLAPACDTCLRAALGGACNSAAVKPCKQDPDCMAEQRCAARCPAP